MWILENLNYMWLHHICLTVIARIYFERWGMVIKGQCYFQNATLEDIFGLFIFLSRCSVKWLYTSRAYQMHPFKRIRLGLKTIILLYLLLFIIDCYQSPNLMAVLLLMVSEKTPRDLSVTMDVPQGRSAIQVKRSSACATLCASIKAT